jgi:hypothetical protein
MKYVPGNVITKRYCARNKQAANEFVHDVFCLGTGLQPLHSQFSTQRDLVLTLQPMSSILLKVLQ